MPSDIDSAQVLLRSCQRLLVNPVTSMVFAVQVRRVLSRISPADDPMAILEPPQIYAAFRAKGLIPSRLVSLCDQALPSISKASVAREVTAEILAICFAACAYPQRASHIDETDLRNRVNYFVLFFEAVTKSTDAPSASAEFALELVSMCPWRELVPEANLKQILSDLSAAEIGLSHAGNERGERRIGAVLFLAGCPPHLIKRIYANWHDDAKTVRCITSHLTAPPSHVAGIGPSAGGWPNWGNVRTWLEKNLPNELSACSGSAVYLEMSAWREAAKWVAAAEIAERVDDFWKSQAEKLSSGFPYYSFQSHFVRWWKQCLENRSFSRGRTVPLTDIIHTARNPHTKLTLEDLRRYREGYRLVRITFFRRADKRLGTVSTTDHANANEQLRKSLDALWYRRLEARMEGEHPTEKVSEIADRFHELGLETINNLNHRLGIRMQVYSLTRFDRLTNLEIISMKREPVEARRGATEHPYNREPGVLTIASLARMVPPENTLLWAFTAHGFLHPLVEPQRPDPWTFKRYVGELWHWVTEDNFEEAVRRGAARGTRADQAALFVMQKSPFKELIEDLRKLDTAEELESYLAANEFHEEKNAALEFLRKLVGDNGLHTCDEQSLRDWRKEIGIYGPHWVIPVWYLTIVEQLDEERLLARLRVDKSEVKAVIGLSRSMAAYCRTGQTANQIEVKSIYTPSKRD